MFRLAASILVLILVSCEPDAPSVPQELQSFPSSEAINSTTVFLTGAVVTTRITSARMVHFSEQDSAWAFELNIDFYDDAGEHTSTLIADSAYVRERDHFLEVFGAVRITTDDGRILTTDRLAWDDVDQRIYTESFVEITRGEDMMSGYGFESDPELKHIKLRRQVSGTLTDTKTLNDSL